jgi:hypothetical protein
VGSRLVRSVCARLTRAPPPASMSAAAPSECATGRSRLDLPNGGPEFRVYDEVIDSETVAHTFCGRHTHFVRSIQASDGELAFRIGQGSADDARTFGVRPR